MVVAHPVATSKLDTLLTVTATIICGPTPAFCGIFTLICRTSGNLRRESRKQDVFGTLLGAGAVVHVAGIEEHCRLRGSLDQGLRGAAVGR